MGNKKVAALQWTNDCYGRPTAPAADGQEYLIVKAARLVSLNLDMTGARTAPVFTAYLRSSGAKVDKWRRLAEASTTEKAKALAEKHHARTLTPSAAPRGRAIPTPPRPR